MRATDVLRSALMGIVEEMGLNWPAKAVIEPPRDPKHGDLAANIAMLLAREAHKNPRELAQIFVEKLPQRCADIEKVEVAGPGFCNVTFSQHFWRKTVCEVEAAGAALTSAFFSSGAGALCASALGMRSEISSPSLPIIHTGSRQGTSSPSAANISRIVPSVSAFSSKLDLSVSYEKSTSPTATLSPFFFCHSVITQLSTLCP